MSKWRKQTVKALQWAFTQLYSVAQFGSGNEPPYDKVMNHLTSLCPIPKKLNHSKEAALIRITMAICLGVGFYSQKLLENVTEECPSINLKSLATIHLLLQFMSRKTDGNLPTTLDGNDLIDLLHKTNWICDVNPWVNKLVEILLNVSLKTCKDRGYLSLNKAELFALENKQRRNVFSDNGGWNLSLIIPCLNGDMSATLAMQARDYLRERRTIRLGLVQIDRVYQYLKDTKRLYAHFGITFLIDWINHWLSACAIPCHEALMEKLFFLIQHILMTLKYRNQNHLLFTSITEILIHSRLLHLIWSLHSKVSNGGSHQAYWICKCFQLQCPDLIKSAFFLNTETCRLISRFPWELYPVSTLYDTCLGRQYLLNQQLEFSRRSNNPLGRLQALHWSILNIIDVAIQRSPSRCFSPLSGMEIRIFFRDSALYILEYSALLQNLSPVQKFPSPNELMLALENAVKLSGVDLKQVIPEEFSGPYKSTLAVHLRGQGWCDSCAKIKCFKSKNYVSLWDKSTNPAIPHPLKQCEKCEFAWYCRANEDCQRVHEKYCPAQPVRTTSYSPPILADWTPPLWLSPLVWSCWHAVD